MSETESCGDDNEDYGLLKKALDVELPADFDPSKVPQTGEQYLQCVMYERSKCKTWLTVNVDRQKFSHKQTFKVESDNTVRQAHQSVLPTSTWQAEKLEDFATFRKYIFAKSGDTAKDIASFDEESFQNKIQISQPKFSEIISYSQAAKIRMLQIISKFLDTIQPGESIIENLGSWIYAVLVLLEKPLSPSSCHTLREFAKKCLFIRSKLDKTANENLYGSLNLFICIVAKFYNQLDLADD